MVSWETISIRSQLMGSYWLSIDTYDLSFTVFGLMIFTGGSKTFPPATSLSEPDTMTVATREAVATHVEWQKR